MISWTSPRNVDQAAVAGDREQRLEDLAGVVQLVEGLEERREADTRDARGEVDESGFARQHDRRQEVVGALGHRDDVGLARGGPEVVDDLARWR